MNIVFIKCTQKQPYHKSAESKMGDNANQSIINT